MDRSFWLERWQTNRLGFHAGDVNPHLLANADRLLGDQQRRVLVPLCGKTLDLAWLASGGHSPVGIEIIELAAQQFFGENEIEVAVTRPRDHAVYSGGGVEIHCADFFAVEPGDLSSDERGVEAAWDRAAMVALPRELRGRYCEKLKSLVSGPILLNTFTYDQAIMDGPPFSIEEDEVREHYADRTVERLSCDDVIDRVPFKERGHTTWISSVYLIT